MNKFWDINIDDLLHFFKKEIINARAIENTKRLDEILITQTVLHDYLLEQMDKQEKFNNN